MLTQGDGRRGVAEQKDGNVEGMMMMRQECWGQNKKSGEQKDGKAEGMQGLPDRALISTDQNIRLLNIRWWAPYWGGFEETCTSARCIKTDLFGLNCNVYIFKLCLGVVEIVLDVARHVSRPVAGLEVLAEKDNDALIMQQ